MTLLKAALALTLMLSLEACAVVGAGASVVGTAAGATAGATAGAVKTTAKAVVPGY